MRTTIGLPDDQRRALDDYCARMQVSRAESVRRAVRQLLDGCEQSTKDRHAALRAGFGVLKSDTRDARVIVDELREEWAERERRLQP